MIKNIIFDLADVIMGSYYGVEFDLEKYNIKPEDFVNRRQQQTLDFFLDTMRGKHSEEEYISYFLDGTNWNITAEQLKKVIRDNLNYTNEETMNIIKKLKGKYNLILLSDHVREWIKDILEYNPELEIFDYKYFSYMIGKIKSDEGAFKCVLEELKLNPAESLFIDDSARNI